MTCVDASPGQGDPSGASRAGQLAGTSPVQGHPSDGNPSDRNPSERGTSDANAVPVAANAESDQAKA